MYTNEGWGIFSLEKNLNYNFLLFKKREIYKKIFFHLKYFFNIYERHVTKMSGASCNPFIFIHYSKWNFLN